MVHSFLIHLSLSTGGPQSIQKLGTQGTQPEGWQSQTTSPKELSTPVTLTPYPGRGNWEAEQE